jgi:hypothetical protein
MSKDFNSILAKVEAAKSFKPGAKVTHKSDIGTDREGTVYEITVEHGYNKIWLDPHRVCTYEELVLVSPPLSKYQKLANTFDKLEVPIDTKITMTYKDDADVLHYTGEAEATAIEYTTTVDALVAAARSGITFHENLIEDMRDQEHLEDYERGSYDFETYCGDMIAANFYDYYDYIECNTEQYDHKRGNTTVTANLTTTVQDLLASENAVNQLAGWRAEFSTSNGDMSISL